MRLIQVGVGGFGETWLGRIQGDHTASLVGLVDTDPQALEAARDTTGLSGARCFEDYEAAMDTVEADAVLNVTPPAVHHGVALAAFKRGLHVLTEKPIADSMEHGRMMVAAASEAGCTLMVSQNYRFRPWARTMRQLLQSGQFGPPDNISVRFAKSLRLDRDSELAMRHQLIRDMSIHHFDLMRAITGREALTVCAKAWQPQWSETLWDGYWQVECPEGVIELRGDRVHIISADMPGQDTEVELQREPSSGQTAALQEFQKAVEERREPETSGRDNLKSLVMCTATVESSRIGGPVNVADMIEQA
ncbi:MAG: Gfo/Idh/MocA family protein [Planctomycetota bacterium]|jgi:predicted dehydrogenase